MNYSGIIPEDIANGLGCRVSIFISGCDNHCDECFNKELWDYNYGKKFSNFTFNEIVKYIRNPLIKGITLLGGDPLSEKNVPEVLKFILRYKKYINKHKDDGCDGKDNIWIYSGYTYEELIQRNDDTKKILENCDVLVDGPFIKDLKKTYLKFRGSSNQRVIDLKQSLNKNKIILIDLNEEILDDENTQIIDNTVNQNTKTITKENKVKKKSIHSLCDILKELIEKLKNIFKKKEISKNIEESNSQNL